MKTKKLPNIVLEVLGKTSPEYPKIGVAMLEWTRIGKLTVKSMKGFCKEVGCSTNQYYNVLKLLVSMGLIKKETPNYVFNKYFGIDVCKEWTDYITCV